MLTFKIIDYDSKDYWDTIKLRDKILRIPLGLRFTPEDIVSEKDHLHIAGFDGHTQLASCMVVRRMNSHQIRRVAVDESLQGKGAGKAMMVFCEQLAKTANIHELMCHARQTAITFYERCGWQFEGDLFLEQGIPHIIMRKYI